MDAAPKRFFLFFSYFQQPCVDSIPTCANQEDHVSMGAFSARKALEILENVFSVITIELYLATQALEFRISGYASAAKVTKDFVRTRVPFVEDDCVLYKNIQILTEMLKSNVLVDLVEQSIGTLQV